MTSDWDEGYLIKFELVKSCGHKENRYLRIFPSRTTNCCKYLENSELQCNSCFKKVTVEKVITDWNSFESILKLNIKNYIFQQKKTEYNALTS